MFGTKPVVSSFSMTNSQDVIFRNTCVTTFRENVLKTSNSAADDCVKMSITGYFLRVWTWLPTNHMVTIPLMGPNRKYIYNEYLLSKSSIVPVKFFFFFGMGERGINK